MSHPHHDADWLTRYERSLMGVFGTPQQLLQTGAGAWVTDAEGRQLLDMLGGIAVNALGHGHRRIVEAITEQAAALGHISNLFTSEPQIRLAEQLLQLCRAPEGSTVFFANSGSEANEAALKAVLKHRSATGRQRILALENSFHGRTLGALSLTHKPAYREPFGPLVPGIEFLPPNDLDALEEVFAADDVAGIFLEPIQGEAGVLPLTDQYLLRARELTRRHQALMVLDEVQTGVGRTGDWFRHQALGQGFLPDLMTLAKGLGSGFPIGALVAFGPDAGCMLQAGQHGTTFGGNPLAAVAAETTLAVIEEEDLLTNAARRGRQITAGLQRQPQLGEIRCFGLHIGIDLAEEVAGPEPSKELVTIARQRHGLIINATGPRTLRLAPPLNITADEVDAFLDRFASTLAELTR